MSVVVLFPEIYEVFEERPWSEADSRREAMDEPPEDEGKDIVERLIDLLWKRGVHQDDAERIVLDLLTVLDPERF